MDFNGLTPSKVPSVMSPKQRFFNLDHDIAQLEFNKSIAGCYRDGYAEYDAVGVLLLTWKEDDLGCRDKEVNKLEEVLRDQFNFTTIQYEIPPEKSQESLLNQLRSFTRTYESPSNLGIIYYGGHAERQDTSGGTDLELFARRSEHVFARTSSNLSESSFVESPVHDRPEQPHISFKAVQDQIKDSETDILMIVDSCYAAGAFTDQAFNSRKCEILCSIAAKDRALGPGYKDSFTTILIATLQKLLKAFPQGFSTSDLYRQIYLRQHQMRKSFHFTQSRFDFGRIWLRPWKKRTIQGVAKSKFTLDVRFHLAKSVEVAELNSVVKSLQFVPLVQMIEMQNMHSPSHDLREFMRKVELANRLRPLLAKVRRRLELRRARQLRLTDSHPTSLSTPIHERFPADAPRDVGLFDWSGTLSIFQNDNKPASLKVANGIENPSHPAIAGAVIELLRREEQADRSPDDEESCKSTAAIEVLRREDQADRSPDDEESCKSTAAMELLSREDQADRSPDDGEIWTSTAASLHISQRVRDGLLCFTLGVLAPTIIGWAVQGSEAAFAAF